MNTSIHFFVQTCVHKHIHGDDEPSSNLAFATTTLIGANWIFSRMHAILSHFVSPLVGQLVRPSVCRLPIVWGTQLMAIGLVWQEGQKERKCQKKIIARLKQIRLTTINVKFIHLRNTNSKGVTMSLVECKRQKNHEPDYNIQRGRFESVTRWFPRGILRTFLSNQRPMDQPTDRPTNRPTKRLIEPLAHD